MASLYSATPAKRPRRALDSNSGGYEYDFVDAIPSKYNCNICMKVLRGAQLTVCCGQHYCDTCLKEWRNYKAQVTCPHCREKNFQSFPNKAIIREINEFEIRCTNKEKGCEWVGELGTLNDHLDSDNGCGYVEVECSNIGCNIIGRALTRCRVVVERHHLTHHQENKCVFREYKCQYCGYEDIYDAIAGSGMTNNSGKPWKAMVGVNHYSQCKEYPLKCPNECGVEYIKRKSMQIHRDACPLEYINCPFCKVSLERRDLEEHKVECDNRPYQCEHCGHEGTYASIASKLNLFIPCHYDECCNYPLKCPNECGVENIKRKDMKTHQDTCPLEPLNCPFQHVGCSAGKIQRKDIDGHCKENMQTHLLLVLQSNQELARKNVELTNKNEEIMQKHEELDHKHEKLVCKHKKLVRQHNKLNHKHEQLDEELTQKIEDFEEQLQELEERQHYF